MTGRILLAASGALLLVAMLLGGCSSSTTTEPTTSVTTELTTTTVPPTLAEVELAHPEVLRITAEELKNLMDSGEDVVVVDTRADINFEEGHITGAINIPAFPSGLSQEQKLLRLPEDQLIVLYCD